MNQRIRNCSVLLRHWIWLLHLSHDAHHAKEARFMIASCILLIKKMQMPECQPLKIINSM